MELERRLASMSRDTSAAFTQTETAAPLARDAGTQGAADGAATAAGSGADDSPGEGGQVRGSLLNQAVAAAESAAAWLTRPPASTSQNTQKKKRKPHGKWTIGEEQKLHELMIAEGARPSALRAAVEKTTWWAAKAAALGTGRDVKVLQSRWKHINGAGLLPDAATLPGDTQVFRNHAGEPSLGRTSTVPKPSRAAGGTATDAGSSAFGSSAVSPPAHAAVEEDDDEEDDDAPAAKRPRRSSSRKPEVFGFVVGSVVWAKFDSYPYWPGIVAELRSEDIDEETRDDLQKAMERMPSSGNMPPELVLVRFELGQQLQYEWISRVRMCPFREGADPPDVRKVASRREGACTDLGDPAYLRAVAAASLHAQQGVSSYMCM